MIKKIICPTDFSDAASNATEYAAKLAQVFEAEILFVNVARIAPVAAAVSMGEGIGANARRTAMLVDERMKDLCAEVNKIFSVSTNYEVNVTTKSFENVLTSRNTENTMIVIGTNGADNMYQKLFGSHTYHVIQHAGCPVLVVPEIAFYGSVRQIACAWGYDLEENFSFSPLEDFRQHFNPEFVFLHLTTRGNHTSREVYTALHTEIEKVLGNKPHIEFDQSISDNIPAAVNRYMKTSGSDLLAINYYKKGAILQWFFTPAIKELIETAPYPILVMPV